MHRPESHSRRGVRLTGSNHAQWPSCLWLAVGVLVNSGCRDAPEPLVQQSTSSDPETSVANTPATHAPSQGSVESLSASLRNGGEKTTAFAEAATEAISKPIGAAPEPQAGTSASATHASTEASSQGTAKQAVEPTPEQLARWARADFEPLQLLACRESSQAGFVSNLVHTPDGHHFLTGGTNVAMWSIATDVPEHTFLELTDDQTIKSLAVSPDGQWFAAGDSEGTLRIWNISDRKELKSKKLYPTGIIQTAISPDSQQIATISYDDEITIWSADQLQQKNRFKVDTHGLKRIEFMTPELLVAAGETTSSWNVSTGKVETILPGGRYNFTMARLPDGSRFVTGGEGALQFWNAADKKLDATLVGDFATEEFIAFSANEKSLATANGSSVRIWDIASGQLVQIIDAIGWPITGLNWLPDTNLLVIASVNGRMRIWGTTNDGGAQEMQPMHSAVATPDRKSQVPASPMQMLQTIDLRIFPRLPEGDGDGRSIDEFNLRCDATVTVDEAQLFYRYQLGKAGWTAYARLHSSHNEEEDGRDLEFLHNGMTLRVSTGRFPADPASYSVQYSRYLTTKSIPVPPDSGFVEFDGATEPFLVAMTTMTLEQAREFYDKELAAEGWLVRDYGRSLKDDHNWLSYVRGQQDLTVGLQSLPTGRTLVRVGDELENSSWQLAKPKAPDAADTPPVGIEAADFPVLNESKTAKFDAIDKSIEFSMDDMPLLEVGERYTKELQSLGWQLDGPGIKADDYVFLTFVTDEVEIALRARTTEGKSIVSIQGDGLLWTKELPGGRKVISYETWLRINHHPASLDLLDEYQAEMRSIVEGNPKAEKPE